MHRLTAVDYDDGGGVTREVFAYDHLGNRVTYWDDRNAVTTAYANNVANEYTSIGGTAVHYDPAGNLSYDELAYEYKYDHENRLTRVTGAIGTLVTRPVVANIAYDALGRMISSRLRFDADAGGSKRTLKYYYDGPNVIAEYDQSDNLSRRYVHGTSYVDERAVLLEGEGENLDSYYYVLQELDTVAGMMKKNGVLAEAYVYDGYGKVHPWVFPPAADYDRSGNYSTGDGVVFFENYDPDDGVPTANPVGDFDFDGDSDGDDLNTLQYTYWNTWYGITPVSLRVSGVGNPYFFTGRRLHFLEQTALTGLHPNHQVQDNRRRHYLPGQGRWLQRDPAGYAASGMNLYDYLRSNPLFWADPTGRGPYQKGTKPPPHPHPWTPPSDHGSQTPDEYSRDWWNLAYTAANFAGWCWDDASKHMHHYLGNTGAEFTIDARGLFTEDAIARNLFYSELNQAMGFVEGYAPGHPTSGFHIVSQTWDSGSTEQRTNWYYAAYRFRAYGSGPAQVLPNCRYTLTFTYHFDDAYDWHAGLKAEIGGITITDDMMRHLHLTGLAREFHMSGSYTRSVTWKQGERFDAQTGVLKEPGGRRGGRR